VSGDEPESKSLLKRRAKDVTELGVLLAERTSVQLSRLPYPEIVTAVETYQRITKGNAKKRQMLYIGKLLRKVDLDVIERLIDRFNSASETGLMLVAASAWCIGVCLFWIYLLPATNPWYLPVGVSLLRLTVKYITIWICVLK